MSIIGWLLLGIATGFIVSRVCDKTCEGWLLDVMLGLSGALMAGVAFTHLVPKDVVARFELSSMLVALAGAVLVLLPYRLSLRRAPS
jgi:uncharacterized membrane protein YeaQ/YmgE (transglycosylase-associated protein family)